MFALRSMKQKLHGCPLEVSSVQRTKSPQAFPCSWSCEPWSRTHRDGGCELSDWLHLLSVGTLLSVLGL